MPNNNTIHHYQQGMPTTALRTTLVILLILLLLSVSSDEVVVVVRGAAVGSNPALDTPEVIKSLWGAMVRLSTKTEGGGVGGGGGDDTSTSSPTSQWNRGWQPIPEYTAPQPSTKDDLPPPQFYHPASTGKHFWVPSTHTIHSLLTTPSSSPEQQQHQQQHQSSSPLCPWCFTSFGCWGGKTIPRQRAVGSKMADTIDALQSNYKCPSSTSSQGNRNMKGGVGGVVKFHIAAGDNFYERGVRNEKDSQFKDKFESSYPQKSLLTLPWLVSLGNHDYRQNFFSQVSYSQAPPVSSSSSPLSLEAAPSSSSSSSSPLAPTGRWYLPFPYYSARVDPQLLVVTLDCPLLERCQNNGPQSPRCWDGGAQQRWFEELMTTIEENEINQQTESSDALKFRVLQCHYPMYANGPHVNHQWLIDWLEPLLVKHCFQIYINADNHYLQVAEKGGVAYVNSGGGAGYGRHIPSNKGYKVTPYSTFLSFTDGFFTHCVIPDTTATGAVKLVTTAYDAGVSNKPATAVFNFTSMPVSTSQCLAKANRRIGSVSGKVKVSKVSKGDIIRRHKPSTGIGEGVTESLPPTSVRSQLLADHRDSTTTTITNNSNNVWMLSVGGIIIVAVLGVRYGRRSGWVGRSGLRKRNPTSR